MRIQAGAGSGNRIQGNYIGTNAFTLMNVQVPVDQFISATATANASVHDGITTGFSDCLVVTPSGSPGRGGSREHGLPVEDETLAVPAALSSGGRPATPPVPAQSSASMDFTPVWPPAQLDPLSPPNVDLVFQRPTAAAGRTHSSGNPVWDGFALVAWPELELNNLLDATWRS